jgi:hypothetical protein
MDNEHTEFNIFLKQIVSAVCQDYGEVWNGELSLHVSSTLDMSIVWLSL